MGEYDRQTYYILFCVVWCWDTRQYEGDPSDGLEIGSLAEVSFFPLLDLLTRGYKYLMYSTVVCMQASKAAVIRHMYEFPYFSWREVGPSLAAS